MTAVAAIARAGNRFRFLFQGRIACYDLAALLVKDKAGLEIGGPSPKVFERWFAPLPIYKDVGALDNCDFSQNTVWDTHAGSYTYCPGKAPGKNIICDGSELSVVPDNSYDFVLSSHNLEHFANPVKALKQWQRVTRPDGGLILVLPNYANTFDHRRPPTQVSHMLEDFDRNTQEDDMTHLAEILELHDLSRDPLAGTEEEFRRRSLDNFKNRCLHHHVFNEANSSALLTELGMTVLAVETALPHHIFLLARMP